ncbi:MAG: hypothetical protein Fur0037_07710 [Planctomycetota bacterium]
MIPLSALSLAIPQAPELHAERAFRFLSAPAPWVVILVLVPSVVLFSWWSYGGLRRLERRMRIRLSALRGLAIAFCILLLCQPAFEITTYRKTKTEIHVLVDDSASMQRKDSYPDAADKEALAALISEDPGSLPRAELVRRVLSRPRGLLERLGETHDIRLFRVQRRPLPMRDLSELTARANRTQLGDALDIHLSTSASGTVDGVVLVSDGRNNAGLDPVEVARRYGLRGIPIFTLGVGDDAPPRNVWIVGPGGPKEALREEEVAFDVALHCEGEGIAGRPASVELHGSRDGGPFELLANASASFAPPGETATARVYCSFREAGDWTLRFRVDPLPGETQTDDNEDVRFLRVNDEKIRVLYVEERPRWEYRYIQNGLKRVDPSIEMQAFLFDASPRFPQEHSEGLEPLTDIPRTEKDLFAYHVVLLGDVAPERLGPTEDAIQAWLDLLVRFVEYGGGVGFLFGDAAMPERYRNTPVQDLLPVVLEDPAWLKAHPPDRQHEFRPVLENPLQPHDILLLRRDIEGNRMLWERGLPGFQVYYPVARAKPGATVLLRHPTDANRYGPRPLAVLSPHPRGETFFIATDETLRWRNPYGDTYQDLFWRNVVRSLASGRLQRRDDLIELSVDKTVLETGDRVKVTLRLHDSEWRPASAGEQTLFLRRAGGEPERRMLQELPGEPGAYQAAFVMEEPGAFSFLTYAHGNPNDAVTARQDVLVRIPDREMADSSQDSDLLRRIAEASSGPDCRARYAPLAGADSLAEDLSARRPFENREETRTMPAWDSGWSLAILLTLLAAEWLIRKQARLI